MRAVLDPNVIISALLSPTGSPARVVQGWFEGGYELVVSPLLLGELTRALAYPKLRARVMEAGAREVIELLRRGADLCEDPTGPPPVPSPIPVTTTSSPSQLPIRRSSSPVIVTCWD